jgi:hypothetical protein
MLAGKNRKRWAGAMLARALLVLCTGLLVSACAQSDEVRSNLGAPPEQIQAPDPRKQTLASKVLGAIALERVTGRKPDPARLNPLR